MRALSATLATSAALLLGLSAVPGTAYAAAPVASEIDEVDEIDEVGQGRPYPGDPVAEAALVANEDARLVDVRSVISSAPWRDIDVSRPYLIATSGAGTLALVPREQPYTLPELAELTPETVSVSDDGSYLVTRHIAVQEGASLLLEQQDGMRVRLASGPDGFSSIVVLGGTLRIAGTADAPIDIGSVDPATMLTDTDTTDGRAYVRVLGGQASISQATVHDLGFWSGETGGLAFTGIEPPDEAAAAGEAADASTASGSGLAAVSLSAEQRAALAVQAEVRSTRVDGNAFGIFASNADGLRIDSTSVSGSLVTGILLHRFVTRSAITQTSSRDNAVDGIVVARASDKNAFIDVTATENGRNGLTLDGRPLADGPSATGTPVSTYGNNSVLRGTFTDNARYGVEIDGGESVSVRSSEISGNEMGIVVTDAAAGARVIGNDVRDHDRHGIAVRDTVTDVQVEGNRVDGAETGIYLRNAAGAISENTVTDAALHGITLVGSTREATVSDNTVSGSGPSAIDTDRARGAVVERNQVDGWTVSRSLEVIIAGIFQPLTIVWVIIILLVAFSVVARVRARQAGIRHPYEDQVPLSSYTRGVVDRSELAPTAQQATGAQQEPGARA